MENKLSKIPSVKELFADSYEDAYKNDQLNLLLNQEPKKEWIKQHPFIKNYLYIPIDKIELMLRKIFKKYSVEITGQGTAFNGVWVTVRVHYLSPITNEMMFHDGIGACQLQTKKDTSPADLGNINQGAISMAFPIAKTVAIKDACDHFGKLFGADLNRKDTVPFTPDKPVDPEYERISNSIKTAPTSQFLDSIEKSGVCDQLQLDLIKQRREELKNK